MAKNEKPEPPDDAPKYLIKGIPKQDISTLSELKDWIEKLLEYRANIDKEDLPDDAEVIEETVEGTVTEERVKCGDESCSCASDGAKHGPYLYRYYYKNGSLTSEYLGKP
jgi:hypothetical protein